MQVLKDKRFLLTLALTLIVGVTFWAGSRVPALNEKAAMGSEVHINALGFETLIVSSPNDPLWKRIGIEAINWGQTNRKGMTFGVLFGGLMMTLFAIVGQRRYRSVLANSVVGTLIGAPLGVCVNCAAPIAAGMASAGARLETTLATMMSSPTLNVIVLTMLFAMFPLHLALLKVGLTFVVLLIVVPILSRYFLGREVQLLASRVVDAEACPIPTGGVDINSGTHWTPSLTWLGRNGGKNLSPWRSLWARFPTLTLWLRPICPTDWTSLPSPGESDEGRWNWCAARPCPSKFPPSPKSLSKEKFPPSCSNGSSLSAIFPAT